MKGKSSFWRKFKAIAIAIGMTLLLTGCDELPEDLQLKIANAFRERATLNLGAASDLHDSGILSDTVYNSLNKSIEQNLTQFGESVKKADSQAGKNMLKAITAWRCVPQKVTDKDGKFLRWDSPGAGENESAFAYGFITNAIMKAKSNLAYENVPILGGNNKKVQPIEVISESLVSQLNAELSIPVYVLKTDISEGVGLDGLMEAVRQAEVQKSAIPLTQYFEPGYYMDGNTKKELTLLDPTNEDEQLVRITKGYRPSNDGYEIKAPYTGESNKTATKSTESYPLYGDGSSGSKFEMGLNPNTHSNAKGFPSSGVGNRLGMDMVMYNSNERVLAVRLIEFNQDALDILKSKIGVGISRYLVIDNKAYLMEYPVGYVDGFKETEDRTGYKAVIKQSQIGFNLLTGTWSKFKTDDEGNITNDSSQISEDDPYLTFDGALSNTDKSKASLVIYGTTGISKSGQEDDPCNPCWNLVFGEYTTSNGEKKDRVYDTGRIVLKDYLEATYAPGVVGNDSLVVLGRKLRLNSFEGNKKDPVASFYDKEGNELEGSPVLYIQDFADIDGIYESSQKVKYISGFQEKLDDESSGTSPDTGGGSSGSDSETEDGDDTGDEGDTEGEDSAENALRDILSKVDSMPTRVVSEVRTTTKFPGKLIGYSDYDESDQKPLFYAMFVRANMFQTALFSGWVQNTDQEKNSTVWWNNWLTSHGYTYRINTDNLVNYLKGNYAYDLAKEGVIILDLETISKIQQEFNRDNNVAMGHGMRTVFMVFGYLLISYAVILLIAWNVDVNVDLGFNILEKLSFGKWIAIKDYDEMPYVTGDTNFIKFSELLVSCIIIITVGLLLILVNIVDLILMLIQLFGGIAVYLSKIITGV